MCRWCGRVKGRRERLGDNLLCFDIVSDEALRATLQSARQCGCYRATDLVIDAALEETSSGEMARPASDDGDVDRATKDGQLYTARNRQQRECAPAAFRTHSLDRRSRV